MKRWILAAGAGVLAAAGTATAALAADYEEPAWTLLQDHGDWEVRRYAASIQAQAMVPSDDRESLNQGFRILADYIFGGNVEGESIAMTVPVTTQPTNQGELMTFTMPSQYEMGELPEPLDDRVQLVEVEGGDFAVLSFRGRLRGHDKAVAYEAQLLERVAAEGLTVVGPTMVAQYNGPLTPGPFRRNEVLVPVR